MGSLNVTPQMKVMDLALQSSDARDGILDTYPILSCRRFDHSGIERGKAREFSPLSVTLKASCDRLAARAIHCWYFFLVLTLMDYPDYGRLKLMRILNGPSLLHETLSGPDMPR